MQAILNATDVRANFGGFIDTIVREKPQAVKRNRDVIMAFSKQQMKELLAVYELTFEYEQDEDGRYAGSIEQIEEIVADGESLDQLTSRWPSSFSGLASRGTLLLNQFYLWRDCHERGRENT